MRIVSFYSFKGGVGRTLSLLNVGYHLAASLGQRVGLVDLDIEAGGLHQILGLDVAPDRDLISLLSPGARDKKKLEAFVLDAGLAGADDAKVFLLPTVADSKHLDNLRWDTATQHFLSDEVFPYFKTLYKLDYLLLDCRSGLAASAVFPLQIAQMEVLVCRLDSQNKYGIARIVKTCRAATKPFRVIATACPQRGRRAHLRDFEAAIGSDVHYVFDYEPRLYFREEIVSRDDPHHALARMYGRLAADIDGEMDRAD